VVNDGSSDNTGEVIQPFLDRIRYFETENGGPAHARNIGMRAATGEYLAFLDSDDFYLPGKLALQVAFMEAFPDVGLVSTEVSAFDNTGVLEEYHLKTYHNIYRTRRLSYEDVYGTRGEFAWEGREEPIPYYVGNIFPYTLMSTVIMVNTVLFRREVIDRAGLQDEGFRYLQCYEWSMRVCKHFTVGFLDVPTYLIRYHEGQHSMCRAGMWWKARSEAQWRKQKLTEVEISSNVLNAVMQWGRDDPEFYAENREWLDARVAEIYFQTGSGWLELGEKKKARESFRNGMKYDHLWGYNRRWYFWSMLPLEMQPMAKWAEKRWQKLRRRGTKAKAVQAAGKA
jgi:glycosyltransferase involved in cell wall biosynthesis